jgi:mono/diheme cytochrome c family protein
MPRTPRRAAARQPQRAEIRRMSSATPRKIHRFAGVVTLLAACALGGWAAFAQVPEPRTVRDGVFSTTQVALGKRLFDSICMNCHEIEEFTGPGAYFEEAEGKTVWDVFEYVWAEMPEDEPASLDPKEYAAILAYTLSVYGLPTGPTDLGIDRKSLEAVTIAGPERPGS